jgi:foldase protein PrsA
VTRTGLVIAVALGALAAGCGSAASTTSKQTATAKAPASATTGARTAPVGSTIPPGDVAVAAGRPISRASFDHWIVVDAKPQSAQAVGMSAIAPTDPPAFTHCIAQVRSLMPSLAKSRANVLRDDCAELFITDSKEVMDFLIPSYWLEAEAARRGLTPTAAQVQAALSADRAQQFASQSAYQAYLAKVGETQADILFRVRVDLILDRLAATENGKQTAREDAVQDMVKRAFRPVTYCTSLVQMADCAPPARSG